MPKELAPADLGDFFAHLKDLEKNFIRWAERIPKRLIISPEILQKLSKVAGFYQRSELRSEVTVYSPIVRYLTLNHSVVTIQEDYEEPFMHLE